MLQFTTSVLLYFTKYCNNILDSLLMDEAEVNHNYYELHPPGNQQGASRQKTPPSVNSKQSQPISKMVIFLAVLLLLMLLLLGAILSLTAMMFMNMETTAPVTAAAIHVQQNELEEGITSLQHLLNQHVTHLQNNTNTVNLIQQSSENTTQKLINIVSTLNNLKGTSTSTAEVIDDILLVVEELLEIHNASVLPIHRPVSCKDIKTVLPNSPTGYYHVNSRNIYCNMGELCGTGGGWTRLAYFDMSNSTANCLTGFRLYQSGGVRSCGRPVSSGGSCSSVQYPSNGISYSQICGRVVGYQHGTPDDVDTWTSNSINTYYVDGVSITRGSPRQHVWTLMAGFSESSIYRCPCASGNPQLEVTFIGSNYFCESGNSGDPLWDGQGCGGLEAPCCLAPGLPWFHRDYGNVTTTDYIELRVCGDESTNNEDVSVSFYEIYIK